jgi:predicted DNA-binding transcriptional regulator AlpA
MKPDDESCNKTFKLWDAKKTSTFLGISQRTLWNLTTPRGGLACVKLGRNVRYNPKDLEAYVQSHTVGGNHRAGMARDLGGSCHL